MTTRLLSPLACLLLMACSQNQSDQSTPQAAPDAIRPPVITDNVIGIAVDPVVWVNAGDPEQSLILGTDRNPRGGLYAFGLEGKLQKARCVIPLKGAEGVDIAYGFLPGESDMAIVSESTTHSLRAFALPDMKPVDGGVVTVFENETGEGFQEPSTLAVYKHPAGKYFVFVSRKNGPAEGFIWQYLLENKSGSLTATVVRKFGKHSGEPGRAALAVDAGLGYVYYTDAGAGIRKYYADPDKGNDELALFATTELTGKVNGLALYPTSDNAGYILVMDRAGNRIRIFPREGQAGNPHQHPLLKTVNTVAFESAGATVAATALNPTFQSGVFCVAAGDRTFQLYRWEDIAGKDLKIAARDTTKL